MAADSSGQTSLPLQRLCADAVPQRRLVIMLTELAAFVPVAAVVICTPGPDTALTIRNALAGGRAAGILTAAGVAIGQGVWTVAASFGLTGLLRASAPAFLALKAVGAAYMTGPISPNLPIFRASSGSCCGWQPRSRRSPWAEACWSCPPEPGRWPNGLRWMPARAHAVLGRV
jgi:hypothetical protein